MFWKAVANIFLNRTPKTIEEKRSNVRRYVTYIATFYVFIGSAMLIASLWIEKLDAEKLEIAKEIFYTVLPVATGVITYWFATRKSGGDSGGNQQQSGNQQPNQGDE